MPPNQNPTITPPVGSDAFIEPIDTTLSVPELTAQLDLEYAPSAESDPKRRITRRMSSATSRTAFSPRVMTTITSDDSRTRSRATLTERQVAMTLLLMDVVGLSALAFVVSASIELFPVAWAMPGIAIIGLPVVLLASLWLINANHLDRREPFWKVHTRILRAIATTTMLALGSAFALNLWLPAGIDAALLDPAVVMAVGSAVLTMGNRSLLRTWMRKATGQARWLLIARHNSEGLDRFWADYRNSGDEGELKLFVELPDKTLRSKAPASDQCPITGHWNELEEQLRHPWSGIIVADAQQFDDATVELVMQARLSGMPVLTLEEFYEHEWHRVPVFRLHNEWFALSEGFTLLRSKVQSYIKDCLDIVLAGGLLLLTSPLMLLLAVAIRLESKGPALFLQPRTGRGGKVFTCYKFRSMVAGANKGPLYASKQDARVTRIGNFIRRCRLDELPQLFNVLRGDMSFIGPRAMWTQIVDGYDSKIPYFQLRHLVRPGLTGWAQVNFHYGGTADDMLIKLEYDLWYLKHQSLFLDLWIVVRTFRVVLFGIGAQ